MPGRPIVWDIERWWLSSVCPSVCPVPDRKSKMEGHMKLKIEARDTDDP